MPGSKNQNRRKRAGLIIGVCLVLMLGVVAGLWRDYRSSLDQALPLRTPYIFTISKGESLNSVIVRLGEAGVVAKPLWLRVFARLEAAPTRLRFGEYEIKPGMTPVAVLEMLQAGKIRQYPVTIIEGWTFTQMRAALDRHPTLTHQLAGKSQEEIMAMLGAGGAHPEGLFFPDTYFTGRDTTDLDILKRAYARMQSILESEWRDRSPGLPLDSAYQGLILASIVEKETAKTDERPAIAGVFIRRLRQGMRLQTDPTVIYGMGSAYAGDIRKDDLRRDTPYNTYTRSGLPPTPIALPGREAIHAALHPDDARSLYFVSRGDGSHVFSATLEEHNRAVNQHQRH